jgi:hypothetical protein
MILAWFTILEACYAAFGVTTNGNSFHVDTAGGLVFDVNKYEICNCDRRFQLINK